MSEEKSGKFQGKVTGRQILPAAASILCLALVLSPIANVQAAELQILAGGGVAAPLRELAAQFESATGHQLVIRFGTTPELIKMATTGGPFDLAVVPVDVMKDAAARARFASIPCGGSLRPPRRARGRPLHPIYAPDQEGPGPGRRDRSDPRGRGLCESPGSHAALPEPRAHVALGRCQRRLHRAFGLSHPRIPRRGRGPLFVSCLTSYRREPRLRA